MFVETIIEVTLAERGFISYRLHPSPLTTKVYGEVLCDLANHLAQMMASEGNWPVDLVYRQIVKHLIEAIEEHPAAPEQPRMIQ